jgi:hypothetical protein
MKTFRCACGREVYFENVRCLGCDRELGFLPDRLRLSALEPLADGRYAAVSEGCERAEYRKCLNYSREDACNWMVPVDDPEPFCIACRLNEVIPNLDKPGNRHRWIRIEQRKRRLVYDLRRRNLPIESRTAAPGRGLGFAFLEDDPGGLEFQADLQSGHVFTGHADGLITINIAEADDVERERMRVQMNEQQRTLLGHFRHESGHYYWQRLLIGGPLLDDVRACFGDERADYASALDRYYRDGPPPDWQGRFVSAYASAHPCEDWAESWGHLLQITDTLETAAAIGLVDEDLADGDLESRIGHWIDLSVKLNVLSRSLDQPDPYPYVLSPEVVDKLLLVDRVIRTAGR